MAKLGFWKRKKEGEDKAKKLEPIRSIQGEKEVADFHRKLENKLIKIILIFLNV